MLTLCSRISSIELTKSLAIISNITLSLTGLRAGCGSLDCV